CPAARGLHYLADEPAEQGRLAAAVLFDLLWIRRHDLAPHGGDFFRVADLFKALAGNNFTRGTPGRKHLGEDVLSHFAREGAFGDQRQQLRQSLRRNRGFRDFLSRLLEQVGKLAQNPVGGKLRLTRSPDRVFEVVRERLRGGQLRGVVISQPIFTDKAGPFRLRQLRHRTPDFFLPLLANDQRQ